MSTFTPSNGCSESTGNNSVLIAQLEKQVKDLQDSLNNVNATLSGEIAATAADIDVVAADLQNTINGIVATVTALTNTKQDKLTANVDYATPASVQNAVAPKADTSAVDTLSLRVTNNKTTSDSHYQELLHLIGDLQERATELESYSEKLRLNNSEYYLKLNEAILGLIKFVNYTDFTQIDPTQLVYTDVNGIRYYIFGQLSNDWQHSNYTPVNGNLAKAATVYLKYQNTRGFDAVINATCTETATGYAGSITATVSKGRYTWDGLAFHLLESTTYNEGKRVIYLAFTCTNSLPEYVAGGLAESSIYVWGIDFIPIGDASSVMPVEAVIKTAEIPYASDSVTVMSDFVASSISFTQVPTLVEGNDSYIMISQKQLSALIPVGLCMNMWLNPPSAVTIPEGWLVCDGRNIADIKELSTAEKNILAQRIGSDKLPEADNMIILAYYPFARS